MNHLPHLSRRRLRLPRAALLALLLLAGTAGIPGQAARASGGADGLCAAAVAVAERAARIPSKLMTAISLAESGRWLADRSATIAWPWTVTSGKDSWYLPDKARAVAQVRALQRRGVRNIDVGCMQINLHYHPDAFDSLEEALDPAANARYAADLLNRLNEAHSSWAEAVRRYHSATSALNRPYHAKVVRLWNATLTGEREASISERQRAALERQRAAQKAAAERRQALQAAYEARRAEERAFRAAAEAKRQAVIEAYRQKRQRRSLEQVASN